jgi:hypothetical protein
MTQYAIMNARTGAVLRIVAFPEKDLSPGLICLPLPDASGGADEVAERRAERERVRAEKAAAAAPSERRPGARDRNAAQAQLAREIVSADTEHQFALLVFDVQRTDGDGPSMERLISAAMLVLETSLSAGDVIGRLSENAIGVVLEHVDAAVANGVLARMTRRFEQLPGKWRARCLTYPAHRREIERLRASLPAA